MRPLALLTLAFGFAACRYTDIETRWGLDLDGDGVIFEDDCDDEDPDVFPGADELCDGIDNDCDAEVDEDAVDLTTWYADADGDGFGVEGTTLDACVAPDSYTAVAGDCDDDDDDRYPDATDIPDDGIDQDCSGTDTITCFVDADQDTYGTDVGTTTLADDGSCDLADQESDNDLDCNDADDGINPGAIEIVGDLIDQNCDGSDTPPCYMDLDGDGFGDLLNTVVDPDCDDIDRTTDNTDCDDTDGTVYPGATELCDGQLNNCDGNMLPNEVDDDGDHYAACTLDAGGWDGPGTVAAGTDCDDEDDTVYPDALEVCDGQLNDCNESIPGEEQDGDGDLYVECTFDIGGWDGPGNIVGGGDCDDTDGTVYPGATELCDGQLNNCGGAMLAGEADDDGDDRVECTLDAGGWDGGGTVVGGDDCDDTDDTVYVDAPELCDGILNDCDGAMLAAEADDDGDLYVECAVDGGGWDGGGGILGGLDCDDAEITVYDGAPELCDGQANDCSGAMLPEEADDDGDDRVECTLDPGGWDGTGGIVGGDDCDDTDDTVYPFATELCDGQDNDCDGAALVDEIDSDDDDFISCNLDAGGWDGDPPTPSSGDCDPNDGTVYPGATEICDGQVNNCGGSMLASEADDDSDDYVECEIDAGGWDGDPSIDGGDDCDDTDDTVYPGASELCDGQLNNCGGTMLAGEQDPDGDQYVSCATDPGGWDGPAILGDNDCGPGDGSVYPGAPEICDGQVNACGGTLPAIEIDNDSDDYVECVIDAGGWDGGGTVVGGGDCNDGDGQIHPTATELCDGVDNDCDEQDDDDLTVSRVAPGNVWTDVTGDFVGSPGVVTINHNDTLWFCAGLYDDVVYDLESDDIDMRARYGATTTFISGTDTDRIFEVTYLLPGAARIDGFTIRNGLGYDTVTNGNSETQAGGLFLDTTGYTVTVVDSEFLDNVADKGGAAYVGAGTLTLTDTDLTSNDANLSGGGVYQLTGRVWFNGGSAVDNVAAGGAGHGGGAFAIDQGILDIDNALVHSNDATFNDGGAVLVTQHGAGVEVVDVNIDGSTVSENTSADQGGAFRCIRTCDIDATDSDIIDNSAVAGGAALLQDSSSFHCADGGGSGRVLRNTASGGSFDVGGGVFLGETASTSSAGCDWGEDGESDDNFPYDVGSLDFLDVEIGNNATITCVNPTGCS